MYLLNAKLYLVFNIGGEMELKNYLSNRPRGFKAEFARKLGISKSFLCQVEKGYSKAPIELAKKIENLTSGVVKKADIRPDVWG